MAQQNKIRKLLTKNVVDVGQALVSLHVPGKVIGPDLSAAWNDAGEEGNILRIETAGDAYVAFDDKTTGPAVTVTTSPAIKLVGAGVHYVVCACQYVRMDVAALRVELLKL